MQTGDYAVLDAEPADLEDPFIAPRDLPAGFYPRPGVIAEIDIALVSTGEVKGTVLVEQTRRLREGANIPVQLVRGTRVVAEQPTAPDGLYVFSFVRPGGYRIRVAPDVHDALSLEAQLQPNARVEGDGSLAVLPDIVLRPVLVEQSR